MCDIPSLSDGQAEDNNCDTLVCTLDILLSTYELTLEVYPRGGEHVGSVTVLTERDEPLAVVQVKETDSFDVELEEGTLRFVFETHDGSLKIMVIVRLHYFLSPTAHSLATASWDVV